jgi:hypothetical protein
MARLVKKKRPKEWRLRSIELIKTVMASSTNQSLKKCSLLVEEVAVAEKVVPAVVAAAEVVMEEAVAARAVVKVAVVVVTAAEKVVAAVVMVETEIKDSVKSL